MRRSQEPETFPEAPRGPKEALRRGPANFPGGSLECPRGLQGAPQEAPKRSRGRRSALTLHDSPLGGCLRSRASEGFETSVRVPGPSLPSSPPCFPGPPKPSKPSETPKPLRPLPPAMCSQGYCILGPSRARVASLAPTGIAYFMHHHLDPTSPPLVRTIQPFWHLPRPVRGGAAAPRRPRPPPLLLLASPRLLPFLSTPPRHLSRHLLPCLSLHCLPPSPSTPALSLAKGSDESAKLLALRASRSSFLPHLLLVLLFSLLGAAREREVVRASRFAQREARI